MSRKTQIIFDITLDQQNIPEVIQWSATDSRKQETLDCKSIMVSLWDQKAKNTMRIDLWTKDMPVDEMNIFFLQSLVTMAESFAQATGNKEVVNDIKSWCEEFAKKAVVTGNQ